MPTSDKNIWMDDEGEKTTLAQKDSQKGTIPRIYRPITCLPIMRKILNAQIIEEIYYSLECRGLFPEEQKGYHKGTTGTDDQQCIDKNTLIEVKIWQKNVAMAWIVNKKAYDQVLKSIEYRMSENVRNIWQNHKLYRKSSEKWKVELAAGG